MLPTVTLPDTVFTKVLLLFDEILAKSLYTTLKLIDSLTSYSSVNSVTVLVIVQVIVFLALSYLPPFNVDLFSSISYGKVSTNVTTTVSSFWAFLIVAL